MGIDKIEEVKKNVDTIEHVEKFNPFHDAAGKFSSSNGMRTYSANPKTKAGQMAIQRSTAAGYGAVLNVHRESKGENIRQNDNWIRSGQKPNASQLARAQANAPKTVAQARQNAHTNRVKGTMGATETATARHPSRPKNQQQAQQKPAAASKPTQTQNTQQTQQAQQTQGLKSQVQNVTLRAGVKLGVQPRDKYGQPKDPKSDTQKICNDHDQNIVVGKDISSTFDYRNVSGGSSAIDKVARSQGWNKGSTVTNDWDTFQKAAQQSGKVYVRTVHDTGTETAQQICKKTMSDGNYSLNGNGMQAYGGGLYTVGANIGSKSGRGVAKIVYDAQDESFGYGTHQMIATVHPNAKIASPTVASKLNSQFGRMSTQERTRFRGDIGAYIASKGYDGAQWHSDDSQPYVTMYNKSAMIYYGGVYTGR